MFLILDEYILTNITIGSPGRLKFNCFLDFSPKTINILALTHFFKFTQEISAKEFWLSVESGSKYLWVVDSNNPQKKPTQQTYNAKYVCSLCLFYPNFLRFFGSNLSVLDFLQQANSSGTTLQPKAVKLGYTVWHTRILLM